MSNTERYLTEFATLADQWFADQDWLEQRYLFITEFFREENLKSLEWEDIQALSHNLHAFNMAIAKNRAAGRPNHDIRHYRRAFEYLVRGQDPIDKRIDSLIQDKETKVLGWGLSAITELVAYLFGDQFTIYNDRNRVGLKVLGTDLSFAHGDTPGTKFLKYNKVIEPLVDAYKRIVGQRTQVPIHLEVDQFMSYLYEKHGNDSAKVEDGDDLEQTEADGSINYWAIAAGERAAFWDEWRRDNVIRIGWGYLGDLSEYESRSEIQRKIQEHTDDDSSHKNSSLACWEFFHVMKPGDIVIVKKGRGILLGYGIIKSDYYFDDQADDFCHVRGIEWKAVREFVPMENYFITTKTLTKFTKYKDYVREVMDQFRTGGVGAWMFQGNPDKYDLSGAVKELPRIWWRVNQHKGQSFKGGRVYLWESGPNAGIVAVATALNDPTTLPVETNDERFERSIEHASQETVGIELRIDKVLPERLTKRQIQAAGGVLADLRIIKQPQGTNYPLTESQALALAELLLPEAPAENYTMVHATSDVFMPEPALGNAVWLLRHSKNVILTGPPGVGKTYVAKRLIWLHQGKRDSSRIETIQFHPAFSYEDFIQGFRPAGDGTFQLRSGSFYDFCLRAQADPGNAYYFVIDEINRAHLSKVFGEVMMLIEPDKRGKDYAVRTAYGENSADRFYVPENVFLIGTMNTADRSLAMVDYALRRRFAFIEIGPAFEHEPFKVRLERNGWDANTIQRIVGRLSDLNKKICSDTRRLGPGYQIGHSYFCRSIPTDKSPREYYNLIIEHEIGPLLREYWFDQEATANKLVEQLAAD